MPEPESTVHRSIRDVEGTGEVAKRFSCDRCRGQKLRCIRTDRNQVSCDRCHRAKAVCITALMLPMGRPAHALRKNQRRQPSISSNKHQSASSSLPDPSSSLAQKVSPSDVTSTTSQSPLGNRHIDETMAMTRESHSRRHWNEHLGLDTPNFDAGNLRHFDALFQLDDANDFSLSHTAPEFSPFGVFQAPSPPDQMNWTTGGDGPREIEPSFGDRSKDSTTEIGPMTEYHPKNKDVASPAMSLDAYYASIEQLSHLSLKFYRLSEVTGTLGQDPGSTHDQRSTQQMEAELQHPISSMIRGLQSFQELLQTLGSQGRHYTDMIVDHASSAATVTSISLADTSGLREASMASSGAEYPVDNPSSNSRIETHKNPSSNNSISQPSDRESSQHLDLPTSLLVMTCYMNLVRLSRQVFHNIYRCLQTAEHQKTSFATLSDLQIGGISLGQDGGLQILVLEQVVARLLDRISDWLGCPNDMMVGSVLKYDDHRRDRMIAPMLIEILQREELRRPESQGSVWALKEEIRKLKEIFNVM